MYGAQRINSGSPFSHPAFSWVLRAEFILPRLAQQVPLPAESFHQPLTILLGAGRSGEMALR